MSVASVLRQVVPALAASHVYEMSARGALFRWLQIHAGELTCSEFLDDVAPGQFQNGVQCQDVRRLTYADSSFDVCTSTEVFEHVPDDIKGFAEIERVLKPGGKFVFTVPLGAANETVERAQLDANGELERLLPDEYHGDPVRGGGPVLAFRNYGRDIVTRLKQSGFAEAEIISPPDTIPWGYARPVVLATKGRAPSGNGPAGEDVARAS